MFLIKNNPQIDYQKKAKRNFKFELISYERKEYIYEKHKKLQIYLA